MGTGRLDLNNISNEYYVGEDGSLKLLVVPSLQTVPFVRLLIFVVVMKALMAGGGTSDGGDGSGECGGFVVR